MRLMNATRFAGMVPVFFLLSICLLLCSCTEDYKRLPTPPPEMAWVQVNVQPDWVDVPWNLTHLGTTHTGVGDSLLTLEKDGGYQLYGGTVGDLVRYPISSPQVGEVEFGDTLTFGLDYAQIPWGRVYPATGNGRLYGLALLDQGKSMVCGVQNGKPRVAIIDRNGEVLFDETDSESGGYFKILDLGEAGVVLAGHTDDSILLSFRDASGAELWRQTPVQSPSISFADLQAEPDGGLLLLANVLENNQFLYPSVFKLDASGGVISRSDLIGPHHRVGIAAALRMADGYNILVDSQVEDGGQDYDSEMLVLDPGLEIEEVLEFGTGHTNFYGSMLQCVGGDVVFSRQNLDFISLRCITEVRRLSGSGQVKWQVDFDSVGFHRLTLCEESSEGNILLVGFNDNPRAEDHSTWSLQLNPTGQILRNREVHFGSSEIRVNAAALAWDGGLVAVGKYRHSYMENAGAWVNRADLGWFMDPLPDGVRLQ